MIFPLKPPFMDDGARFFYCFPINTLNLQLAMFDVPRGYQFAAAWGWTSSGTVSRRYGESCGISLEIVNEYGYFMLFHGTSCHGFFLWFNSLTDIEWMSKGMFLVFWIVQIVNEQYRQMEGNHRRCLILIFDPMPKIFPTTDGWHPLAHCQTYPEYHEMSYKYMHYIYNRL